MSLSSTGDLDKLNMIAEQLNDLTEQHLIGLLDDATYAFQLICQSRERPYTTTC